MNPIKRISTLINTFIHRTGVFGWNGALQGAFGRIRGTKVIVALRDRPTFFVRATGSGSDVAVCQQVFNDREYAYACPKEVRTIVDAGANIGCSAVYFAERHPSAHIISVEPSSENFELLRINTRGMDIECIHAALWSRDVELEVFDRGEGSWSLHVGESEDNGNRGMSNNERILGITLGELRRQWNLETIDILKVDIEGGEREVFAEGPSLLDGVNVLIVETHDRWSPGSTRVVYEATRGFAYEWIQGENIFFCREGWEPADLDQTRLHKISTPSNI